MLLLVDYDGTLTPIAARPSAARLSAPVRALLRRLSRLPGVQLGIVSGRALRDVRRHVGLPGLWYAGNHGLELQTGQRRWVHPAARRQRPYLRRLAARLRRRLRAVPGAWVEWKGVTCSVHWRAVAPYRRSAFHRIVAAVLAAPAARGRVRCVRGKRVVDMRPVAPWHKGAAVRWLQRQAGGARTRVVYVGDDRTDEDAFRAVNRQGGLSICVGRQPTAARYRLSGPAAVRRWLSRVERVWRRA